MPTHDFFGVKAVQYVPKYTPAESIAREVLAQEKLHEEVQQQLKRLREESVKG